MKVLFLTASYPVPEHPLLGIFVKEHARAVAPHCELAVIHLDRDDRTRALPVLTDSPGEEWPTIRARYPRTPTALSYAGNLAAAVAGLRRLRARGFVPDVIHAHFFLAGVPAVVLGRLLRRPVVLTEQWSVFLPDDPATLSPAMRRVARFAFEHADVVAPVSGAVRDGIRALGVDADFRVVPNTVDTERFHPDGAAPESDGTARLIGVGGLYDAKGWEYLIDALPLVADNGRRVEVDLVGDGELRAALEARATRAGVADRFTFHGWLPKEEVAERVRRSDLFVLTSRYDSNPCAVIEAFASGVPVVATAVGGLPDMVQPDMGVLAKPGDPASIAGAIDAALARGADWNRLAIAQAAHERYGVESVGRAFASIYDEVVARRR